MRLSAQTLIQQTRLAGRWRVDGQSLISPLLGSTISFNVVNTSQITVDVTNRANPLSPSQYFTVQIDGGNWLRWPATIAKWQIRISPVKHHITVMTGGNSDRDDVWFRQQDFTVNAIELDDGGRIKPVTPSKSILILGDSITAGCWVNGKRPSIDYRPESNYVGVAQSLLPTIEFQRVAYSAAGVIRLGTGNVPRARQWLDHFDADHDISPQNYDLVIVALGVNDRRFSVNRFRSAYQKYVNAVLTRYQCPVALMVPFLQSFKNCIQEIGQRLSIPVINTDEWCQHTVDGLHPDQQGSNETGQHFAQVIKQLLQ